MKKYSESWQPYQLRVSLIGLVDDFKKPDLGELFGVEVQDTTISGVAKDLMQTATYGAGLLTMRATQVRVDFFWESLPPMKGLVRLGVMAEAAPLVLDPLRRLVSDYSWSRVAFGALCGAEVPDRASGYKQLDERLEEVAVDPTGSSDFLYQINRPSSVATPDGNVVLNLFRKWAVAKVKFRGVVQVEGVEGNMELPELRVAQVVMDFNTPAVEEKRLSGEAALKVLEHAISEASELLGE